MKQLKVFLSIITVISVLAACGEVPVKPFGKNLLGSIDFSIQDQDKDKNEIQGELVLKGAPKPAGYSHYAVYWSSSASAAGKGEKLTDVPVAGLGNVLVEVIENTKIKGKYFLLFLKQGEKEVFSGVSAKIVDKVIVPKPPTPPAPQPKVAPPKVIPKVVTMQFKKVFFDLDEATIKSEYRMQIESQILDLDQKDILEILIEGHADERGSNEYNIALGNRRAEEVKRMLVGYGVDPANIKTVSYGEERPAADGSGESAWRENRRAEIKNETKEP